jgi:hypothetical protein
LHFAQNFLAGNMRWILAVPLSSALLTAQANDDKAPTPQQVVINGGKSDV